MPCPQERYLAALNIGRLLLGRGGSRALDEALRALNQAHAIDPRRCEAPYELGTTSMRVGWSHSALMWYQVAARAPAVMAAGTPAAAEAMRGLMFDESALVARDIYMRVCAAALLSDKPREAADACICAIAAGGDMVDVAKEQLAAILSRWPELEEAGTSGEC